MKKMISFEIPDDLRETLRLEAFKRNKSVSATIREILEESLRANEIKKPAGAANSRPRQAKKGVSKWPRI